MDNDVDRKPLMHDGAVFAPLTNKITVKLPVTKNADVLFILNKDFRESLTLCSLVLLCKACCMRPTAPMLAFALQNSIPGLVGLPMDNPDPGFYIDIAKKFFDPTEISYERKMNVYRHVHYYDHSNQFFPRDTDLDAPSDGFWPCMMDYYVESMIPGIGSMFTTKKGRDFVKEVMLGWKSHYEKTAPNDPRYPRFINHVLNILEHGMILRYRHMRPGWLQGGYHGRCNSDEHL